MSLSLSCHLEDKGKQFLSSGVTPSVKEEPWSVPCYVFPPYILAGTAQQPASTLTSKLYSHVFVDLQQNVI